MTQPPPIETDLATAIGAVYRAPLEDFIIRRDELAKQPRADKRRDDAALVKALRKPSRIAWTLDGVVHEDPVSIDRLAAAISEAQSGADLRIALEGVKEAVRAVAAAGARVAVRAEHPIEPNTLAGAVQAIIGDENAFAELRAGRLVDVPEGGGLDLLFALTANSLSPQTRVSPSRPPSPPAVIEPVKPDPRIELEAAARALLLARTEVDSRRDDVDRTQRQVHSMTANLEDAQRAVDDARRRLAEVGIDRSSDGHHAPAGAITKVGTNQARSSYQAQRSNE